MVKKKSAKFPSTSAYLLHQKLKKKRFNLKKFVFNYIGTSYFHSIKTIGDNRENFVNEAKDSFERDVDWWGFRKNKVIYPVFINKKFIFYSKKVHLLLKYFYFFYKMYCIKNNFARHVDLITNHFLKIKVCFFIRAAFSFQINADLVGDFLVLWFMKKKFTIKEILGTLLNFLNKAYLRKNIGGYSILMRGRFTRKDRAMYSWKKIGAMPLSHRISTVDYCNRWVPLRYSQCAFKIYILKLDSGYVRKQHRNIRKKNELKPTLPISYLTKTEPVIFKAKPNPNLYIEDINEYKDYIKKNEFDYYKEKITELNNDI